MTKSLRSSALRRQLLEVADKIKWAIGILAMDIAKFGAAMVQLKMLKLKKVRNTKWKPQMSGRGIGSSPDLTK